MRCSTCGAPAVIYLKDRRKYLCAKHFAELLEAKVESAIERYGLVKPGSMLIAAVSGGKDSTTMIHVLSKLSSRLGFKVVALHIDLGLGEYSIKSLESFRITVTRLGLPYLVVKLEEALGVGVPELAKRLRRPYCSVCGMVKRYLMNAVAVELGASYVALGHNADDLMAYALKAFLSQDYLSLTKFGPKTEPVDSIAAGRVRPLYEVTEKESLVYALTQGLSFVAEECPFLPRDSLDRQLKHLINAIEESRPGFKASFMRSLALRGIPLLSSLLAEGSMAKCSVCGLASMGGECSFCRSTRRVLGEPAGPRVRKYVKSLVSSLNGAERPVSV